MSSKKWVIALISITMTVVLMFGALQYYLDPLLQYGGERGPLTFRRYNELYGNPGIAKNYNYNAVLLGSSIIENTKVDEMNDLFNCNTAKVPYAGGHSYEHRKILDVCYGSGHRVDKVFWALDEFALTVDADTPRWPLPEYLYDDNKINDISYLLNLDIFYYYTLQDIKQTLSHKHDTLMMEGTWGDDESIYSKDNAVKSITYPKRQKEVKEKTYYEKELMDNLDNNIIPVIENHPETEFHFFLVPYSVLWWYIAKSDGELDAHIYDIRTTISQILEYENVKVHFFQGDKEIITNLDLYKDYLHYNPDINSWMLEEMKKESHLLTKGTYNQTLDEFHNYLISFDYNALFEG